MGLSALGRQTQLLITMKYFSHLLVPSVLALSLLLLSASPRPPRTQTVFHPKAWKKVAPRLFAAATETSNWDYQLFLEAHPEVPRPDSSYWSQKLQKGNVYADQYFVHPAFMSYPVVNVSHQQAHAYCQWLTEVYHKQEKREYERVVFRLPTESEWERAARGGPEGGEFPWDLTKRQNRQGFSSPLLDHKGRYRCNFRKINQVDIIGFRADSTLHLVLPTERYRSANHPYYVTPYPVWSLSPNLFGLYNMAGNAAEMVNEAGISKGGSWLQTAYHLRISSQDTYQTPAPDLGFRVFMEVIRD